MVSDQTFNHDSRCALVRRHIFERVVDSGTLHRHISLMCRQIEYRHTIMPRRDDPARSGSRRMEGSHPKSGVTMREGRCR